MSCVIEAAPAADVHPIPGADVSVPNGTSGLLLAVFGSRRTQRVLIAILALVALLYATRITGTFHYVDEANYYRIATHLRDNHMFSDDGIHPTTFRPPVYPALIAGLSFLHEGPRFAQASNLVWWLAGAVLISLIATRLYGRIAGNVSLLITLFSVTQLYTAGILYPQTLTAALFLLSVFLQFQSKLSGSWKEVSLQGLIYATLILAVPLYMANFLVYLAFGFFKQRRRIQLIVPIMIVAAALFGWSLRNKRETGSPVLISSNGGFNLLLGNSPASGPDTGVDVDVNAIAPEARFLPARGAEQDAVYKRYAILWMKTHPGRAAVLYAEKFLNWFNFHNKLMTKGQEDRTKDLVMAFTFYPLLLCACLRFRQRTLTTTDWYLVASYLGAAGAYAVFFTRVRFRLPYDDLLIVLASGAIAQWLAERQTAGASRSSLDHTLRSYPGAASS